jgi:DNA polymerase-3 subunit delta'
MLFSEIAGQDAIKKRLVQSVKDNRVSHAQLFLGPEGSGNLALAIGYAQYISCQNKSDEDSCGHCSSCIKYNKLAHPDLHFVFPVNSSAKVDAAKDAVICDSFLPFWREAIISNAYLNLNQWYEAIGIENKQGLISAKESSEIVKKLALKTYESEFKVLIIWMPEKMNVVAANKLLKILEEPPAKTLFLLVCENQEFLLSTVLSRTQLVKTGKLSDQDIIGALVKFKHVSPEAAADVAYMSDGNYNEALRILLEKENEKEYSDSFIKWMRFAYSVKVLDIIDWIDIVAAMGRERQKGFLNYCIKMFRESMMMNYADKSMVKLNGEMLEFLSKFSPFIHGANCLQLNEEFNKASMQIERNANPKILFMDLSFKLMKLLKIKYQ